MRKLPEHYPLYDNVYISEIPVEQLFIGYFNALPSKYSDNLTYKTAFIDYIQKLGFVHEAIISNVHKNYKTSSSQSVFINEEKQIIIKTIGNLKNKELCSIFFSYNIKNGKIEEQLNFKEISEFVFQTKLKSHIYLVKNEHNYLDIEEFELKIPKINIPLNYGEDFLKIHKTIVKRLNTQNDKGIILLHGDPGTGKCVHGETKIKLRNKKTGEIFEKNINELI